MFSHVVIFWTDPNNPNAAEELIAGMNKYLKPIPGVLHYHATYVRPDWSKDRVRVARIGRHVFYR